MAEDKDNPDLGATDGAPDSPADTPSASSAEPVETPPSRFVDRDDDSSPVFTDPDYAEDFPAGDSGEDDGEPDPGYAAFSSELEDPLADWPSPDAALEELPEVRQAADRREQLVQVETKKNEFDDESPMPPSGEAAQFENDSTASFSLGGPDMVDRDQNTVEEDDALVDAEEATPAIIDQEPVGDAEAPEDELESFFEEEESEESVSKTTDFLPEEEVLFEEDDDLTDDFDDGFGEAFNEGIGEDAGDDIDEDLVDDFLNDLDPPDDESPRDPFDLEDEASGASGALMGQRMSDSFDDDLEMDESEDSGATGGLSALTNTTTEADESNARGLPIAMIAVVALALLLLAVGGYGVVKQRGEMQSEIRDLQARLATTISPEEAEAEREAQRQIAVQNESLAAEIDALGAENAELAAQLETLEAQLAERQAAAKVQAEAAAKAQATREAAARRSAEQAAAQRSTTQKDASSTSARGPWFVNFGSYAQRDVANRWADRLETSSGEVIVQSATAAGKQIYRVRVVGLANQDEAERIATRLERQYQLPRLWVGKN